MKSSVIEQNIFYNLLEISDIEQAFLHLHPWRPNKLLEPEKESGIKMLNLQKNCCKNFSLIMSVAPFAEDHKAVFFVLGVHAQVDSGQHNHSAESDDKGDEDDE